jgi:hypothetical protein
VKNNQRKSKGLASKIGMSSNRLPQTSRDISERKSRFSGRDRTAKPVLDRPSVFENKRELAGENLVSYRFATGWA